MSGVRKGGRFVLAMLALAAQGLPAKERMRAGMWEETVTSDGKSITKSHCVTSAEVETTNLPSQSMREATEKAFAKSGTGNCSLKDFRVEGDKITSVTVCGPSTFKRTTTFSGDTFETTSTSTTARGSKVTLIKGRRTGACP